MQAGHITVGGIVVGTIDVDLKTDVDSFVPDFSGYAPIGRADGGTHVDQDQPYGGGHHGRGGQEGGRHGPGHHGTRQSGQTHEGTPPSGRDYPAASPGHTFPQGSSDTDAAIARAAREHHLDPNFMRSIASIESGMTPSSNANRSTQYKGLYQIGHDEWRRTGDGGNIYSAEDNAMAAGRLFTENSRQFEKHFGRAPSETELYMMHQQGLGFYTRGAMTNIGGNPYPGMHGPQTHESFEAGWGREISRRKAQFAITHPPAQPEAKKIPDTPAVPEDL